MASYIVRLLILRGETNVRVLDIVPPHEDFLASHPAVTYTKVDITSPLSVHAALVAPFPSGALPSVVFHTAAAIRFWERAAYTFGASHRVNVLGTAAVLEAAKKLQTGAIVVYTSSADVAVPAPRFMQYGKDYLLPPWDKISISDDDAPLNGPAKSTSCYARSKLMAERLVLEANSADGLRTGCLRPGQYVLRAPPRACIFKINATEPSRGQTTASTRAHWFCRVCLFSTVYGATQMSVCGRSRPRTWRSRMRCAATPRMSLARLSSSQATVRRGA